VTTSPAGRFAASYTTLSSAHDLADYWAQTRYQATNKGRHGNAHENAEGRRACLTHVATYTMSLPLESVVSTVLWGWVRPGRGY
jgi:hypothetical protein